jgi:hypothetical protein
VPASTLCSSSANAFCSEHRQLPGVGSLIHTYAVAEIVAAYGYPESAIVPIVIAECTLVVLYLIPQTSVLAAILMTGYLGGAVATHLRIGDTARAAIPLVVGILAWGGLYLRDSRIRQLVPFRRSA